ncbi:acyl-CoA dehydrogenase family protein [Caldimonas thermodepolymerans]|uniref:acyl-CoA dehydrogenase family protein n=1 Tax=Caldimonas thermodepolymerans TaxID=215580 RepID=UPI002235F17E|nr:acyl-CoA dehydrogenase [Caldimonas thermodepolymerans]UZG45217.1 acyl-CoA dehydrogenase [Caldimonas thermodepolymerans]
MDFSLDEEQVALQDAVRRYCDQALPLHRRGAPATPAEQAARWRGLAELGVIGWGFGEDVGGSGGTAVETWLVAEELGRALDASRYIESAVLCGRLLDTLGDARQRQRWLPPLAEGRSLVVLALQEGQAGTPAQVAMRAMQAADGWRLDGIKTHVMHAPAADVFLVAARTSGAPGGLDGLSLFAVPAQQAGLSLEAGATLDGQQAATLRFDAVSVPDACRIGAAGQAGAALEAALDAARAALCAESAGALSMLLEMCIQQLKDRRQFGRPLADFQALQHRLADLYVAVEQVRAMSALAAMAVHESRAGERARLVSAARVTTDEAARFVGEWAVQLHGAMGMTEECLVAHYVRRLLVASARYGTTGQHLQRYAAHREEELA